MMVPRESQNLIYFNRYVMNDIPIRLIRLSDMKIVGRNDAKKHFRNSVPDGLYDPANHVKYAILSHRWLDEGEPTYKEMEEGTARGPGYEKLKSFCEYAKAYGVEFAWLDTCCIDKSSSTELDESIRSMFRWYKNSVICIVHLAQSDSIKDIRFDEWTERGWTLQELLAPTRIKFFNKDWIPMTDDENDKDSSSEMLPALERATGIPRDILSPIQEIPQCPKRVDERMGWASRRKTTRAEDAAYSLMGIFNVSMQIAYGEGGSRAFCRLIEAIMQSGDPSVLNWMAMGHHSGSLAIPQSPSSFTWCRDRKFEFDRPLEMTMTSLGLRMPLVVLPLDLHITVNSRDSKPALILGCSFCPTLSITACSVSSPISECQYAFGIVNYSIIGDGTRDVLGIRGRSAGVVLFRQTASLTPRYQPPSSNDIFGLNFACPPEQTLSDWKLVDHLGYRLDIVDFPNIPSGSHFYIHREYLQTVYL